jgi:hypothetical protein
VAEPILDGSGMLADHSSPTLSLEIGSINAPAISHRKTRAKQPIPKDGQMLTRALATCHAPHRPRPPGCDDQLGGRSAVEVTAQWCITAPSPELLFPSKRLEISLCLWSPAAITQIPYLKREFNGQIAKCSILGLEFG